MKSLLRPAQRRAAGAAAVQPRGNAGDEESAATRAERCRCERSGLAAAQEMQSLLRPPPHPPPRERAAPRSGARDEESAATTVHGEPAWDLTYTAVPEPERENHLLRSTNDGLWLPSRNGETIAHLLRVRDAHLVAGLLRRTVNDCLCREHERRVNPAETAATMPTLLSAAKTRAHVCRDWL